MSILTSVRGNFFIGVLLFVSFTANSAEVTDTIKLNMLKPCGTKPNCVSTGDSREAYYVAPFEMKEKDEVTWIKIASVLNKLEGFDVVESSSVYHRIEFTSKFLKYIDDVEFFLDKEKNVIKIRSQSREGYWDLGANRRRVTLLQEILRTEDIIK